jgi:hypothetical protein
MMEHQIRVGTLVTAKRASGICKTGERGVCYETYTLGGRPGYSFIFERGGYDGFSPEDVDTLLTVSDRVCPEVADYQFTNVVRLTRDFEAGRFAAAFAPPWQERLVGEQSRRNGSVPDGR